MCHLSPTMVTLPRKATITRRKKKNETKFSVDFVSFIPLYFVCLFKRKAASATTAVVDEELAYSVTALYTWTVFPIRKVRKILAKIGGKRKNPKTLRLPLIAIVTSIGYEIWVDWFWARFIYAIIIECYVNLVMHVTTTAAAFAVPLRRSKRNSVSEMPKICWAAAVSSTNDKFITRK